MLTFSLVNDDGTIAILICFCPVFVSRLVFQTGMTGFIPLLTVYILLNLSTVLNRS